MLAQKVASRLVNEKKKKPTEQNRKIVVVLSLSTNEECMLNL